MLEDEAGFRILLDQAAYESRHDSAPLSWSSTAGPMAQIVDAIIKEALRRQASDIHIEPLDDCLRVRYRQDGLLQVAGHLPRDLAPVLAARIKVMAGLDSASRLLPQDGHIRFNVGQTKMDIRVSVLPSTLGETLVLRIMADGSRMLSLDELGLSTEGLARLRQLIHKPAGMVAVVGPMNSGKSTVLYAALEELARPDTNIVTLEDPVERHIHGVTQVQINPKVGLTYAVGLRAALRQDASIVLASEVRDLETAEMVIRIALTGHAAMTTLHTDDAAEAVFRLQDMGIPPYMLAATLNGVVAQRLLRRVCRHCAEEYEVEAGSEDALMLGKSFRPGMHLWRARGCEQCHGTGYRGRLAIQEILFVTPEVRQGIMNGLSRHELKELAQRQGMVTLEQDGIARAVAGLTTQAEVRRVIYG